VSPNNPTSKYLPLLIILLPILPLNVVNIPVEVYTLAVLFVISFLYPIEPAIELNKIV
jgi:hypothetical protein